MDTAKQTGMSGTCFCPDRQEQKHLVIPSSNLVQYPFEIALTWTHYITLFIAFYCSIKDFRLSCNIVSFTAWKTNLIFSVSMAVVK